MRVPIQCGSCLHFNHSKPSFKLRHWFPSLKVVTSWIQNHDASEHNSRYWSLLSLVVRIKFQSRQYLQFPSCDCESCNGNDQKERNSKWCIYEMWSNPSKNHVQICACIYIHVHLNIWLGQPCSMQPQPSTVHIQGALANYKAKYRTVPYLYAITRVHFTWSLHAKQIDLYSLVHFDKWVKWFRSPHDLSPVKRIWMEPFEPFFSLPATLQSHNISISALQVFKKRR